MCLQHINNVARSFREKEINEEETKQDTINNVDEDD